jgi:hypothetical protein
LCNGLGAGRPLESTDYEPGCATLLARQQRLNKFVVGVGGVPDDASGFFDTPSIINVLDGERLTSTDALG